MRADCGIAGVGEGARLSVTETGDIVLIAAEILLLGCPVGVRLVVAGQCTFEDLLEFEGTKLLIYYLPDYFVGRHNCLSLC